MKKYTLRTVKYYNLIADSYLHSDAAVVIKDNIDRFISLLPGERVLDVGCGPGHDTNYLTERGFECLGVDLSRKMIQIAKKNFKGKFKVADFFSLRFRDSTFDGLWCSSVFVHVQKKDLPKLLTSFRRILKNNGILGIITVKKQKIVKDKNDMRKYVMYDKNELEKYLENKGYEILVSETFPYGAKERLFLICKNKK